MVRYESRVVIDRPVDAVFPYLVEPEKQALWSDVAMRQLTAGPVVTGSRMELKFGMGPIKATVGMEYTTVDPGRRVAFRTFSGPIRWDGEYRLSPSGAGGTELSQEGTLTFTGLWRLAEPLVGGEIKNGEVKELEKLKAAVEAS
jgi:uncharacterized protein YndB with AHSA1/START domain